MSTIVNRVVIGKWNQTKTEYREVEVDTSNCKDTFEVEVVSRRAADLVDKMLLNPPLSRETRQDEQRAQQPNGTSTHIPSEEALNRLPWQRYDKSAAGPGEQGWIRNPEEFPTFKCEGMNDLLLLVVALKASTEKKQTKQGLVPLVRVGGMEYSFTLRRKNVGDSGYSPLFVTREVAKQ
jgi:hypothetical protein